MKNTTCSPQKTGSRTAASTSQKRGAQAPSRKAAKGTLHKKRV